MSTMAQILDSVSRAFVRRDMERVRLGLIQAASKLGGKNGQLILDVLARPAEDNAPRAQSLSPLPVASSNGAGSWRQVAPGPAPHVPSEVARELARWDDEFAAADALAEAGERVMPLLLVGEPRCGKTSYALSVARKMGRTAYRLDASSVVSSFLGESAKALRAAFDVTVWLGNAVFVIDELDAIAPLRSGPSAQDKERNHVVGCLLTWLEELPPHVAFICTTNRIDAIDSAVAARMKAVEWPAWSALCPEDVAAFMASHGAPPGAVARSYAHAVEIARRARVDAVLANRRATQQFDMAVIQSVWREGEP